ncbi:hypothetical protein ACLE20_00950 [Rhizobium sp. YIM 134829]|uniref:hypothetical protein n=1 Tax=Rhizobium sp. YIM 134829 TaxID=3390453 RepID=UPI00397A08C0
MDLCICLSGQLRAVATSFENLKAATAGSKPTFIFSVWSKVGRRSDGYLSPSQLFRMFDTNVACALSWDWLPARITDFLPEVYNYIETSANAGHTADSLSIIKAHFPDAIIDIEEASTLDLSFDEERQDLHSLRMLYKLWRVNEIKRKVEKERSKRFDYVVRMRPDFRLNYFDDKLVEKACTSNHILVDGYIENQLWCDDSLAIGKSDVMDIYSGIFGRAISNRRKWDYIHRDLARHLQENDISFSKYPHHGYIAPDVTVDLQKTIACLNLQRQRGHVWSDIHLISLQANEILEKIKLKDLSAAARTLENAATSCFDLSLPCDGLLFAASYLMMKSRNFDLAVFFGTASSILRARVPLGEHWNIARIIAKSCVLGGSVAAADNSGRFFEDVYRRAVTEWPLLVRLIERSNSAGEVISTASLSQHFDRIANEPAFSHYVKEELSRRSAAR